MKSTAAVEAAIARINEIDSSSYELNSVLALDESATARAAEFDEESAALPLQGAPILIKDNIEAIGLPASAGSLALKNTPVLKDSTIAERLRRAGAVIVGSTNLSEWANIRSTKSTSGWSALGGLTANPWKHGRSAGGSSSGSGAAVAAGLTQWAIGSETDGSIICPSSLNGCVGIKPTVGSIPSDGVIPISSSQDSPGPMAQTVAQAALLLDVLTDRNEYLAATQSESAIKVGVVREWMSTDSGVSARFEESLSKLEKSGIKLVEVALTPPGDEESDDELIVLLYELNRDLGSYLQGRSGARVRTLQEVVEFNLANSSAELQHFGQELFDKALEFAGFHEEYQRARARNKAWAEKTLTEGLSNADVLIGCTYGPAWLSTLGEGDNFGSATWITTAPSIAGTPIGTIPMGLVDGLPVGLGFVSGRNQEGKLISAMSKAEHAFDLGVLKPTFIK
jgi:amidase